MAVRKAVRAATTTFTAISIKRFFIIVNVQCSTFNVQRLILVHTSTGVTATAVGATALVRAATLVITPLAIWRGGGGEATSVALLGGVAAGEALHHRLGLRGEGRVQFHQPEG